MVVMFKSCRRLHKKNDSKSRSPLDNQGASAFSARSETRTHKDITPTASETATFTNFAIRAAFRLYEPGK